MKDFPKIQARTANAEDIPEIAGYFSIFTVPVLILFADGKEMVREARFVHVEEFKMKVSKIYEGFYAPDE